jgi:hypothetical protein
MTRSLALVAAALIAGPAFAQWPDKPDTTKKPEAKTEAPPLPPRRPAAHESAPADEGSSGFAFGVRGVLAFATGDTTSTRSLDSVVSRQIPLWVEAGWRFTKNIYAGAYFSYSFGSAASCFANGGCGASGMRFGVEGIYNLMPDAIFQPWAGLGIGYEVLYTSVSGNEETRKGLELFFLQLGVDWALTRQLSVGPFGAYTFGKFTSVSSGGFSNDIPDANRHHWLQLGVKATFKL